MDHVTDAVIPPTRAGPLSALQADQPPPICSDDRADCQGGDTGCRMRPTHASAGATPNSSGTTHRGAPAEGAVWPHPNCTDRFVNAPFIHQPVMGNVVLGRSSATAPAATRTGA